MFSARWTDSLPIARPRWARAVMDEAARRLREEYAKRGKAELFEAQGFATGKRREELRRNRWGL
jgi:hypothetical protein